MTLVQLGLAQTPSLKQLLAGAIEGAVQEGQEGEGLRSQDLTVFILDRPRDVDALEDGVGGSHGGGSVV